MTRRRDRSSARTATRFFVALVVLLGVVALVIMLSLHGLSAVEGANRQISDDNLPTTEATSRVDAALDRVEVSALEVLSSSGMATLERRRANLQEIDIPAATASIATLLRIHRGDPPAEHAKIVVIPAAWQRFLPLTRQGALTPGSPVPDAAQRSRTAAAVETALDPLVAYVASRQVVEHVAAAQATAQARHTFTSSRTWLLLSATAALVAAAVMVGIGATLRRLLRVQEEAQRRGESVSDYTALLQGTESEGEAQEILCRQIERTEPGAHAVVMSRNNSADRLEARTSLAQLEALREPLELAVPRSCLAVRFARGHTEGTEASPLIRCELCGRLDAPSTCEPLLVGGEVIGSVLVAHATDPTDGSIARVRETVAQAAPVLGNLRNLAIAELRAATDRLTGLPNQRAVGETLKRMVAQAARTITALSAVLVDLDHFKEVNDLYGHDRGDELLAAVGVALRNAVRESDFVGRYGGEEFLVLLPSTDTDGAVVVAEAVRAAIAAIRVAGVDRRITASAGVATLPRDAGDSVSLFRAADRALYGAKRAGRDCVQVACDAPEAVPETSPRDTTIGT